jgi:hypothetical protein
MNQSIYRVHRRNDARTDTSPSSGLDLGTPAWHPYTLHLSSQHANSTGFARPPVRRDTPDGGRADRAVSRGSASNAGQPRDKRRVGVTSLGAGL